MAGWKCPRCGTSNDDIGVVCSRCGASRGAVVLPDASAADRAGSDADQIAGSNPDAAPAAGQPFEWHVPTPTVDGDAGADAAPASGAFWRRLPIGLIVFVAFLGAGAVGSFFFSASRSDTGEVSRAGDMDASDLRVGDCFDFKDPEADAFDQVTARPCTEEHGYELFFVGTMPAETYPTDDGFDAYVSDSCEPAFASYVGRSYDASRLEMTWVAPTSDAWNSGDHVVQCLLNDPARPRLTTSLRGVNL